MTLKKLTQDHYIIVDDSEIKEGDWVYQQNFEKTNNQIISIKTEFQSNVANDKNGSFTKRKITYSTDINFNEVYYMPLSEIKELIGEVDVEKKATEYANTFIGEESTADVDYKAGYNQALEDNKEKKYTDEDVIRIVEKSRETGLTAEYLMITFQPKTEWEVEFVDGKLKLK